MNPSNKPVVIWLAAVCVAILTMVVVGGITRLTESGLSMVDWRPVIGIIPPLGDLEWQRVFEQYKNFPQYQQVNTQMTLADFKYIFYWEYGHRVLGRLIGLMFFVPFIAFLMMGRIPEGMKGKLWIALVLGGLQGLMGWYMVKSGLVDLPRVSHFRLAAHLSLALLILAYLGWIVLELLNWPKIQVSVAFRNLAYLFAILLILQILYGAFVAGIRAGYGYNTFPTMNGDWFPDAAWMGGAYISDLLNNLFYNSTMIQFMHRWLGAGIWLVSVGLALLAFRSGNLRLQWLCLLMVITVTSQFLLGVFTLLLVVPISLASIHQAGACVVLLVTVMLLYSLQVSQRHENLPRPD